MPTLRINKFTPAEVPQLNKWADQHDQTSASHTQQLSNINTFLQNLFDKNPTLVKPTDK